MHLFNPGNEMEILCGKSHYTPPYTVQKMAADLELLPVWYGGAGSFTLVRNVKSSHFVLSLPKEFRPNFSSPMILNLMMKELYRRRKIGEKPKLPPLTAAFWGISPRSIAIFSELKQAGMNIEVPEWKEDYLTLTRRQTAAECLKRLQENIPITPAIKIPEFFSDMDALKTFAAGNRAPFVVKTPFSSSGRGLYWLTGNELDSRAVSWMNGALKKQGVVSIEPVLDKVMDFAVEFYADGQGEVRYAGLSVFETQAQGQFIGCMLGTQEMLMQRLNEYISTEDFLFLAEQVRLILQETVGASYTGYMGVDMMIYKTEDGNYAVHPFVELNLRYTMGLVAMQLCRQFIHPASQGMFRIVYYIYDTQKEHQRMQEASPLVIEDGRIRSGYISLCPVDSDTHYMAIIDVFE
ncbi:MAG: hypothetical protein LBJ47_01220 [Tannerella sp.]|nr:hypothetical protein [Tannerella sp.]